MGPWQIALYFVVLTLLVKPLGAWMARVYRRATPGRLERVLYRIAGVDPAAEMSWKQYAVAMLLFNLLGFAAVYALQRLQAGLPLNPDGLGPVTADTAFNTAVSFVTNTNWQAYGGEVTMSYLTQMLALTVQNFVSAATGMAVLVALIRGLARQGARTIGSFWVDMTRSILYILLPLALVLSLVLVSQGVVQTLKPHAVVTLLEPTVDGEGRTVTEQRIARGPAASQIAIKQLGTNGGGFFNTNSSHPLENPTPFTNLLEMLCILLIPAALTWTYGCMVGDRRQGWALYGAMIVLVVAFLALALTQESAGDPALRGLPVDQAVVGGNMEGKETRLGVAGSTLWATVTTAASNGSVNSMHDSYTPLGGLVPLVMMMLGEVAFGGVGSGLYGMLAFVIVTVFVAGLMVGRTPEYLGKKIEAYEMKMASLILLIMPLVVLVLTAVALLTPAGRAPIGNPGAHGYSEVLYLFTSQGNNNGSAFAGIGANTPFYNILGGIAMIVSRYWLALPALALAGSLGSKRKTAAGPGTLPTHTPLFVGMLLAVILIVGALNFFPALSLGPIVEHLEAFTP